MKKNSRILLILVSLFSFNYEKANAEKFCFWVFQTAWMGCGCYFFEGKDSTEKPLSKIFPNKTFEVGACAGFFSGAVATLLPTRIKFIEAAGATVIGSALGLLYYDLLVRKNTAIQLSDFKEKNKE
jgi:hypothetical protein